MELEDPKRKSISDFYREEFLRHKTRLEEERKNDERDDVALHKIESQMHTHASTRRR